MHTRTGRAGAETRALTRACSSLSHLQVRRPDSGLKLYKNDSFPNSESISAEGWPQYHSQLPQPNQQRPHHRGSAHP